MALVYQLSVLSLLYIQLQQVKSELCAQKPGRGITHPYRETGTASPPPPLVEASRRARYNYYLHRPFSLLLTVGF